MSVGNSYEQDLDAHGARTDFENVLQDILEKANAEDRLTSDQEDEKDSSNEDISTRWNPQATTSPQKPATPKATKRRRRREEQKDDQQKPNSFITKLFDRSVDLAAFTDQTPLYPMCRAWMENNPYGRKQEKCSNGLSNPGADSSDEEEKNRVVSKIARANVPWKNIDDNGKYKSPRVPDPLPRANSNNLDRCLSNPTERPAPETLLVDHLQHWKKVRQTWRLKSIENDARYRDGMMALRDMFMQSSYNHSAS